MPLQQSLPPTSSLAEQKNRLPSLVQRGRHLTKVSRLYGILEADLVQSCIESDVSRNLILDENGAALGHDLALDHTRNYRIAREMPSCKELVFLDSVLGVRDTVLVNVSLFYKKHRLTVRHELFDFFDIHNSWTFNGLILRIF